MRHISTMTKEEMNSLQNAVQDAAVAFAQFNNFSGLSHAGWFDFYGALQDAIEREWKRATAKTVKITEERE